MRPFVASTKLHAAAMRGDHDRIRTLVAEGHDVNASARCARSADDREREVTPLMAAAGAGFGASADTVRLLLELGADATIQIDGQSAADYACSGLGWQDGASGDEARLRAVLDAGAPLPRDPASLSSLLCDVCAAGDAGRATLLLSRGAPANPAVARSKLQARAAQLRDLAQGSVDAVLESIAATFRAEDRDALSASLGAMLGASSSGPSDFEIPLFCAAESGDGATVRALLEAGADPSVRDGTGCTAVFKAASIDAVRALVDAGLSLEDRNSWGWSPLDDAVNDGPEGIPRLRALLAAGANPNATHDRGFTVFMGAASAVERSVEVMRLLVEAGADPHAVTDLGWNAFHAAVDVNGEANEPESVRSTYAHLQSLGVDINHRADHGVTPLQRAIEEGTGVETEVLCQLGADVNTIALCHRCDSDGCERIEMPLLFGAIDAAVDSDWKTKALLEAGALVAVCDDKGRSPLEAARAKLARLRADTPCEFTEGWIREATRTIRMLEARSP